MTEKEAEELLKKYEQGLCTPEELSMMDSWYKDLEETLPYLPYQDSKEAAGRVWQMAVNKSKHRSSNHRYYFAVAAIISIIAAFTVFQWFNRRVDKQAMREQITEKIKDIQPGSNKAVLTLADGRQVVLDNTRPGKIALQGDVSISKNEAGQLVYAASPSSDAPLKEMSVNTIFTPKGGQYEVLLPDGTHVWLNAASSLKYPVRFTGSERKVTLTGEGYFEVTKNAKLPFVVEAGEQQVKVLGTHFNISAYTDEEHIKTTLAEGKVSVSMNIPFPSGNTLAPGRSSGAGKSNASSLILLPDQQAINTGGRLIRKQVNASDVIAWRDGLFVFNGTPLVEVMREMSRWYNVEIEDKDIPNISYEGEIPRSLTLLQVLKLIRTSSGIAFKLEGRRISRE